MEKEDLNKLQCKLCSALSTLDRLQVELCDDTPYEMPTAGECRTRILRAMEYLETVTELCEKMMRNK